MTIPLPLYPLYQCCFNNNNCFSSTSYVSITMWILWCMYHIHIHIYIDVTIIISPPRSPLSQIFLRHCCSFNSDVYIPPHIWCITDVPYIYVLKSYIFIVMCCWLLLLHLRTSILQVQCWYLGPQIGGHYQYRVSVVFHWLTSDPLLWPLFHWTIIYTVRMTSWKSVSHAIPPFYIYLVPRIIQVEDTKFLGVSFNFGVYLQAHRWLLGLGIRFNAYMKRGGRPTILSYCENNPPSVSHQNSMSTMDKSDLPDSPNIFLLNKWISVYLLME